MSAADDLAAERFGKSLWWKTPTPKRDEMQEVRDALAKIRAQFREDDITTARRRRAVADEMYPHDQRQERAS